jgi:transposase-like protein
MVSFGFKRSCPLVEITQRPLPRAPLAIKVGRHYETGGAPFRERWGTITTEGRKVPHFPSKPRPTCVVTAPHFPSESVPHFARNPHSATNLELFIKDSIESGSEIHTDGWPGYAGVSANGFRHKITVVTGKRQSASELLPRVHLVASLLKRWLLGTHQGAVSREHLDYYMDEFTFRFNRRHSKNRGKLFYRLVQQAVAVQPAPYKGMVRCYASADEENHNR